MDPQCTRFAGRLVCNCLAGQVLLDGVPCPVTSSDLTSVTCLPGPHPSATGSAQGPVYRPGPTGLVLKTWRNITGASAGQLGAFSQWPLYPLYPNTTMVSTRSLCRAWALRLTPCPVSVSLCPRRPTLALPHLCCPRRCAGLHPGWCVRKRWQLPARRHCEGQLLGAGVRVIRRSLDHHLPLLSAVCAAE